MHTGVSLNGRARWVFVVSYVVGGLALLHARPIGAQNIVTVKVTRSEVESGIDDACSVQPSRSGDAAARADTVRVVVFKDATFADTSDTPVDLQLIVDGLSRGVLARGGRKADFVLPSQELQGRTVALVAPMPRVRSALASPCRGRVRRSSGGASEPRSWPTAPSEPAFEAAPSRVQASAAHWESSISRRRRYRRGRAACCITCC